MTDSRLASRILVMLVIGTACRAAIGGPTTGTAPTNSAVLSQSSADSTLGEIVVTAEKRKSTIQATPISMSALSGAQLAAAGVTGLKGIALAVPGISMRTAGPGQSELEMRGLSSSGGSSPTVGFYLNDYPLSPPAAAVVGKVVIDPGLYDVSRVEVLRGPQGTLYGSGSMGGTIKLVTNEPQFNRFYGSANVIGSDTDGGGFNHTINVMLNLPVIDNRLALRIVGTNEYNTGWVSRAVVTPFPFPMNAGSCGAGWPGCIRGDVTATPAAQHIPRVNWERLDGGRIELLGKINSDWRLDALAMFQKITMGGYSEYDASQTNLTPAGGSLTHYQPYNINEPFSDQFSLFGVTLNGDLGFAKLTSATEYYSREERQTQDASEALYSVLNLYGFPTQTFEPVTFSENDWTKQISQELRLTSSSHGRLQWIAGAFFSHFESIFEEINNDAYAASDSTGGAAANPLGIVYQAHNPYYIQQYALFGEADYALTHALKLTTGLRWYRFQTNVYEESSGISTASGNAVPTFSHFTASSNGFNPKVTLSYEPTDKFTGYVTAARGFRPGGVNQQIPVGIGCNLTNETYGPDNVWNYELGEKSRRYRGRVIVNADIFYIRWGNVQQLLNQGCGYPLTQNAGTAESYGPELEVILHPTEHWTVSMTGTHTHAALKSVNPVITQADPYFSSGLPILNIPNYTGSLAVAYDTRVSKNYRLSLRATDSYVGSSTDISYTYATLAPYDLVDLRAGLIGGRWTVNIFADNVTNKHAQLGINTTSFDWVIPSLTRVATNTPRTIGVDLSVHF